MKRFITVFFLSCFCFQISAQNQVQISSLDSTSIADALSNVIFGGCVQINNITYAGSPMAFGLFIDPDSTIGIHQGLVMSTGETTNIADSASNFASTSIGTDGDLDLSSASGQPTNDAVVLEFDFTPNSDTIFATKFVFGSEEYPEWVCSSFNDIFAFYISGVTVPLPQTNVALIPNTSIPIAINTVNDDPNCGGDYSQYYIDNASGTELVFDGLSTLIQLAHPVTPGETYHMKIAIADAGDEVYDSGVFLKAQTFCGNFWYQNPQFLTTSSGGLTFEFENQSYGAQNYLWDFGDGNYSADENPTHTYSSPGTYPVTLTCSNSCQENETTMDLHVLVTGLENDLSKSSWEIVQNRGLDLIELRFESQSGHNLSYRVVDVSGKIVRSEHIGSGSVFSKRIDISSLNTGLYFFQLSDGNQTETQKFIK